MENKDSSPPSSPSSSSSSSSSVHKKWKGRKWDGKEVYGRFPRASCTERLHRCSEPSCPKHFAVARFAQRRRDLIEFVRKNRDDQRDLFQHLDELEASDDELWIMERIREEDDKDCPPIHRVNPRMLERKAAERRHIDDQRHSINAAMKLLDKTVTNFMENNKRDESLTISCGSVDALTIRVVSWCREKRKKKIGSPRSKPTTPFKDVPCCSRRYRHACMVVHRVKNPPHDVQHCMTCGPVLPAPSLPYFSRSSIQKHVHNVLNFRPIERDDEQKPKSFISALTSH